MSNPGRMSDSAWLHSDNWKRMGTHFLVEVARHSVELPPNYPLGDGPHRWCVYAYIYAKHPRFARFDGDRMWQQAAVELPLHGGSSYLKWHSELGKPPHCVQVGADYNHLHDDRFTHYATEDEAAEVFRDAGELFDFLMKEATTRRSHE